MSYNRDDNTVGTDAKHENDKHITFYECFLVQTSGVLSSKQLLTDCTTKHLNSSTKC